MSAKSYAQFAEWLRLNEPAAFKALQQKTRAVAQMGYLGDDSVDYSVDTTDNADTSMLDEITVTADASSGDAITTNFDSLSDPVSLSEFANSLDAQTAVAPTVSIPTISPTPAPSAAAVGTSLANSGTAGAIVAAVATVASSVVAANTIKGQAARAAAGLSPANVTYATSTDPTTGIVSTIPVLNTTSGQIPVTNESQLMTGLFGAGSNSTLLLLGIGALLFVAMQ